MRGMKALAQDGSLLKIKTNVHIRTETWEGARTAGEENPAGDKGILCAIYSQTTWRLHLA